jgi:hypothetical protein
MAHETYEQALREGLEDLERWRAWFRPLCGKVSRVWLSPELYARLGRALWAYREGRDLNVPWMEALTIYGVHVACRSRRVK